MSALSSGIFSPAPIQNILSTLPNANLELRDTTSPQSNLRSAVIQNSNSRYGQLLGNAVEVGRLPHAFKIPCRLDAMFEVARALEQNPFHLKRSEVGHALQSLAKVLDVTSAHETAANISRTFKLRYLERISKELGIPVREMVYLGSDAPSLSSAGTPRYVPYSLRDREFIHQRDFNLPARSRVDSDPTVDHFKSYGPTGYSVEIKFKFNTRGFHSSSDVSTNVGNPLAPRWACFCAAYEGQVVPDRLLAAELSSYTKGIVAAQGLYRADEAQFLNGKALRRALDIRNDVIADLLEQAAMNSAEEQLVCTAYNFAKLNDELLQRNELCPHYRRVVDYLNTIIIFNEEHRRAGDKLEMTYFHSSGIGHSAIEDHINGPLAGGSMYAVTLCGEMLMIMKNRAPVIVGTPSVSSPLQLQIDSRRDLVHHYRDLAEKLGFFDAPGESTAHTVFTRSGIPIFGPNAKEFLDYAKWVGDRELAPLYHRGTLVAPPTRQNIDREIYRPRTWGQQYLFEMVLETYDEFVTHEKRVMKKQGARYNGPLLGINPEDTAAVVRARVVEGAFGPDYTAYYFAGYRILEGNKVGVATHVMSEEAKFKSMPLTRSVSRKIRPEGSAGQLRDSQHHVVSYHRKSEDSISQREWKRRIAQFLGRADLIPAQHSYITLLLRKALDNKMAIPTSRVRRGVGPAGDHILYIFPADENKVEVGVLQPVGAGSTVLLRIKNRAALPEILTLSKAELHDRRDAFMGECLQGRARSGKVSERWANGVAAFLPAISRQSVFLKGLRTLQSESNAKDVWDQFVNDTHVAETGFPRVQPGFGRLHEATLFHFGPVAVIERHHLDGSTVIVPFHQVRNLRDKSFEELVSYARLNGKSQNIVLVPHGSGLTSRDADRQLDLWLSAVRSHLHLDHYDSLKIQRQAARSKQWQDVVAADNDAIELRSHEGTTENLPEGTDHLATPEELAGAGTSLDDGELPDDTEESSDIDLVQELLNVDSEDVPADVRQAMSEEFGEE